MPRTVTKPKHQELAAELARNGLSYTQFGQIVEANPQYVSQIVRGSAQPSEALMQRMADALGRPVDELFAEVEVVNSDDTLAVLVERQRRERIAAGLPAEVSS